MNGPPELSNPLRAAAIDALLPTAALSRDEAAPRHPSTTAHSTPEAGRTDISDTGQLLDRLLRLATQGAAAGIGTDSKAANIAASTVLLATSTPGAVPARLALALHEAITTSGLFYESHLASWVAGQRSSAALALEPQGQLAPGTGSEEAGLPQLVKAQLDVMEKREVHWQGQVWPDVPVTLSVQEHSGGDASQHDTGFATPQWQSQMQLQLPALGNIQARLHIVGERLQLSLAAGRADTVALLHERADTLGAALADSGTPLQQLSIKLLTFKPEAPRDETRDETQEQP